MERWELSQHRDPDGVEGTKEYDLALRAKQACHLDIMVAWKSLEDDVKNRLPAEFTRLNLQMGRGDPDDSYSRVAYEKGFHLLFALEKIVGETVFLGLVRAYLKKFQYGLVTSEEFRDFCIQHFEGVFKYQRPRIIENETMTMVRDFDWNKWLNGEGMPPMPTFDETLAKDAMDLCEMWMTFDAKDSQLITPSTDISNWSTQQKVYFLNRIEVSMNNIDDTRRPKQLKLSTLKAMKESYKFHQSMNCELLLNFCKIAVECGDEDIYPVVVHFITTQGRMKYVRPLYRALYHSTPAGKHLAIQTFIAFKDFYHPIAAKMLAADLGAFDTDDSTGTKSALHRSSGGRTLSTMTKLVLGAAVVTGIAFVLLRKRK